MKMRILSLLSLVGMVFILSCKKKELNFSLEGNVWNQTMGTHLAGAAVSLEEIIEIGSSDQVIHETTVAADGTFKLEFKRQKATKYLLRIEKENYFPIERVIFFSEFSTEEPLKLSLSTTAKAWVKLVFINEPPAAQTNTIRFIKMTGKSGCVGCCPDEEQVITGTETKEFIYANDGNAEFSYQYSQQAPVETAIMKTVTPAFDTVSIIKYW